MKILVIASCLNKTGGIQRYNTILIRALRESGYFVRVIEMKNTRIINKVRFILTYLWENIVRKPEITFCAHINFSTLSYFAFKVFKVPYIVETYGIEVWNIKSKWEKRALENASAVTAVARYTRDKIIDQIPNISKRVFLLYNTIDGDKFSLGGVQSDLVSRYGTRDKKVILTIARLSASEGYKGYDMVIRALPLVIERVPNVKYIIGGTGDDVPRVKKCIKDMGLEDYVIMAGYVSEEELVSHYRLADVFAMPSKGEGFATVFLEALACGVPVLGGDGDGSRDPLQDGECGFLVDPENLEEIAEAIVTSLVGREGDDRVDRQKIRTRTIEKYGYEAFKGSVAQLMQKFRSI